MFGIQPLHLVIIAVVALLIFGPSKLPEIGRGVGKALTEFRRGIKDMGESFQEEVKQPAQTSPSVAYLTPAANPQPVPPPAQVPVQSNAYQPSAYSPVPAPSVAVPGELFCTQCGSPNQASARFCNTCGSPLVTSSIILEVDNNAGVQNSADGTAQ